MAGVRGSRRIAPWVAAGRIGAGKGAAAPPPKARPGTVCLWLRGRLPGGRRPLRQRPVSGGKARGPPRRRAWSSQGLVVYVVVVVVAIQPAPEIARKAPETNRNGRKEARERPAEHVASYLCRPPYPSKGVRGTFSAIRKHERVPARALPYSVGGPCGAILHPEDRGPQALYCGTSGRRTCQTDRFIESSSIAGPRARGAPGLPGHIDDLSINLVVRGFQRV